MEEQLNPLAVTHLLQHTLRSLCTHDDSQWVYAVFWRILPRNYPPPKWDLQGGVYDRTRGNRRNWILAWEDGFCNFAASACDQDDTAAAAAAAAAYTDCAAGQEVKGLQPELFFKMSHDIYSYGEGLIGKVAADHSHKWVFQEAQEHEINLISSWNNPADSVSITYLTQLTNKFGHHPPNIDHTNNCLMCPPIRSEFGHIKHVLSICGLFAASKDMGGSVSVWYQDHCSDRRQRRRCTARLHEQGGGGPELRGDAAAQVQLPGEHPGGAAAAPVVGRVPGRVRRRTGGRDLAAGSRAADGALRPLRPGGRRGGADEHRAVDEQPGGAPLEAALGRPRGRRRHGRCGQGGGGRRPVPRRHGRGRGERHWQWRRKHQRRHHHRSPSVYLLRQRG